MRIHPETQPRRGGMHRHTQTEDIQKHKNTHKEIHQPRARTPGGAHTRSGWGRVQRSRRPGKVRPRARRTASEPRAARPSRICWGRLSQRISEQGPAGLGVRGSLRCGRGANEAPAFRQGPGGEVWPARRSVRDQPSPRRQSPPCPAPEPGPEHPQVLSSLLVPLRGKLSPGRARRRAAQPRPTPGRWRGGLLPARTRLRRAAASSRSRTALRPALLSSRRRRRSRSLPSRYPGNRLRLPPANQPAPFTWRLAANGLPRHPGPLPGSRALSQAGGLEREIGVSPEPLLVEGGPPGGRERHLVPPAGALLLQGRRI